MMDHARSESKDHVVLIGIDAYAKRPLRGCVNDIDAVQDLLLGPRMNVSRDRIKRLASPHPGARRDERVPSVPATLANVRAALAALGSDEVARGDRVFIYYSGHGARAEVKTADGPAFSRESLVPVDFDERPKHWQLLFDFEINALLAAIAARTSAVTVIFDCCHSAGATREVPASAGMTSRFMDLRELGMKEPVELTPALAADASRGARGVIGGVDDCHVVAACLGHELAQETMGPDGVRHGLLTRSLITALGAATDVDLRSIPWGRIWQRMRAEVETANPLQHPWMSGNMARAWFAGAPREGDIGLAVARVGDDLYQIDAGTLASVTVGAEVALYGETPLLFPPLGSAQDVEARLGLVTVTSAGLSSARAEANGAAFDLPPGARGRLVKPSAAARVRCAVVPPDEAIEASLAASPLLEVVRDAGVAQVRLERVDGGGWAVTDDVHGAKPGYPVLFELKAGEVGFAREVLEHHCHYALPLRMAAACGDLPGALEVALLACPKDRRLTAAEAQAAALPEVESEGELTHDLLSTDGFCIRVRNTSTRRLRVTLWNAAASGKVQPVADQVIDGRKAHVFWSSQELGKPFRLSPPPGAVQCIDRMVAIGTTAVEKDLGYLRVDTTFAEIVSRTQGEFRDFEDATLSSPPAEQWTATQTVIRTRRA